MLSIGIKHENTIKVTEELTAKVLGSGTLDVYATPAMIALMEKTAMESVGQYLEEGQGTVGININVDHVSASPIGATIKCISELTGVDGRKLSFFVSAFDDAGLIGEGTHQRFIIKNESFQAKANGKLQK